MTKKLFFKLLLAALPFLVVIAIYVYHDPFKVLRHYDHFEVTDGTNTVPLNRDYINTEMFLNNYGKYRYDAFIFGNSRSGFYPVTEWQKHIGPSACFHYDAYLENLQGVEKKIAFLHSRGVKIKNALFVLDNELLAGKDDLSGPTYRKHPLLSGENEISFQLAMFKYFLEPDFMTNYLRYLVTHKVTAQMAAKGVLDNSITHYDDVTNERTETGSEAMIARNRDSFYNARSSIFYKRDGRLQYAGRSVKDEQVKMLTAIKDIFTADNTDYRIIISPLYNQKRIDTTDLRLLISIFGRDRVYDFSGVNDITEDMYNYYETSHYRPHVAARIMDSVYNTK